MKWINNFLVGNPFLRVVPPATVVETTKNPRFDATGRRFSTTTTRLYMVILQNDSMGYTHHLPSRVATAETLTEMVERVFAEADPKDRQYGSVKIIRMELEVPQVILDKEDA
ncbi:MAG: hypothetical protein NTZ29_15820 [Verrucomicrobia bacterium]|nr:hypothetical protein [Verrucomicrobiota bacterium]